MWTRLGGAVIILLALWQFYISRKTLRMVQKEGNQHTSSFIGFSLGSSFYFAVILLLVGISLMVF
ncbi:MAG: hypothetical protein LKJ69_00755 [Lactobacillus sp.]|jgi:hypothetical protein|nr:hypothetical protein [Lactobacillus sp.]MCI2031911.1 hypothetical protein [Lactobacillus sp.]